MRANYPLHAASRISRLVLAHQPRVAGHFDSHDPREAARRSLFGDAGLAHAVENGLEPGQVGRVVAPRRPGGAEAGDGEGRVEGEAGLDGGTRLVQSAKLRQGGGQVKIRYRIISVGLDRPPTPRDRLLPTAEVELRQAHVCHPNVSRRVAWTEALGLGNVSLGFFGAAEEYLTQSDQGMGAGKISIQRQRILAFGDALRRALGEYLDKSQCHMAARMVGDQRQRLCRLRFSRSEDGHGIGHESI